MKDSVLVSILAIASVCVAQFDPEQCGPRAGNQKCGQNKCCSQYGWCGNSNAYCQASQGCQAGFGRCTGIISSASPSAVRSSTPVASPSAAAAVVSRNGRCGSAFGGQICKGSTFGDCCSSYNWCGKTTNHCKASLGCQLGFGTCTGVQSSSISVSLSRSSTTLSTRASTSSSVSSASVSSQSRQASNSPQILATSSVSQSSSMVSLPLSSSATLNAANSPSSSLAPSSSSSSSIVSSSPIIASSSAISSTVPSSSSAVASSSSTVVSSSLTVVSSSLAVASSSPSSLTPSATPTPASPSIGLISSTNVLTPSPSPSGTGTTITHVLLAARNPSVDRTDPQHFVPKNALSFYFAEDSTTYTKSIDTTLDSGAMGILLENIASLAIVTCSGSSINLQFTDETSANTAKAWPAGTILFTLSDSCNSGADRGVYKVTAPTATPTVNLPARLRIRATTTPQAERYWQLPLEILLIQMQSVVANYDDLKRQAAEEAAAQASSTARPTPPGTILSAQSTSTASINPDITILSTSASSTVTTQPLASPSAAALPACGGYAPGGRFTIAGTDYQISCTLSGTWHERWIDVPSYEATYPDCVATCSADTRCKVATWVPTQVRDGKYMCLKWSILPFKTDPAADAPMAVKVV